MKISEIDLNMTKTYLRVDGDEEDLLIEGFVKSAKEYVANYTGHTLEDLENYEDVAVAVLVIVAELYDNRTISVNDKLNLRVNELLTSLLGRHSINLL